MEERILQAEKIMKETALGLVGCGYIYGATGWVCTQARMEQQAAQYPEYAESIRKYGQKWMGKKCYDCAQATKTVAKAAGVSLPSGATSQWNKVNWAEKGERAGLPMGRVAFLYRQSGNVMQHTGIYLGDGTFVDARGHQYGVLHSKLDSYAWTHWAIPEIAGVSGSDSAILKESASNEDFQNNQTAIVTVPDESTKRYVFLRGDPSTKNAYIGKINEGAEVTVLEVGEADNGTEWATVSYQGKRGYMMAEFLAFG